MLKFADRKRKVSSLLTLIAGVSLSLSVAQSLANAQEWGSISGRIVFDGEVPSGSALQIERDADVCGNKGLTDESLVVNSENRGVRYVAVWLEAKELPAIHPDFSRPAAGSPVLDNINCRFEPHMLAVRTGQTIYFRNSDPIAHNAAVYARRSTPFSEVIPQSSPLEKKFPKPENLPVRVDCSIHPWMKSWLLVLDHPYVSITDADGRFEIQNIPAGEWRFRFWHERQGYLQQLTRDETPVPLSKGSWTLKIAGSDMQDLGELKADGRQFAPKK